MKDANHFLGFPMTAIAGMSTLNVVARTQVAFRPTYIVIPANVAPDFLLRDLKIGKNSEFISYDPLHAGIFSGEVVVLKDQIVKAVSNLPLAMKMDNCYPENTVCLTVTNINANARNFFGALVGPPL